MCKLNNCNPVKQISKLNNKLELKPENVECSTCTFDPDSPMVTSGSTLQQQGISIDTSQPGVDISKVAGDNDSNMIERLVRQHGKLELIDWNDIINAFDASVTTPIGSAHVHWFTNEKNKETFELPCNKYPCVTQLPPLPAPRIGINELYIGLYDNIPLWYQDTVIHLAAYAQGWPTEEHAQYAAVQLYRAAQAWNEARARVRFEFTTNLNKATYIMTYGGDNGSTYARAEFPSNKQLSGIYVYSLSFSDASANYLVNILEHELGHTLGLRHEFAPEKEGLGEVIWGPRNPQSVMDYKFPPTIQQSDVTSFKELYDYAGTDVNGVPIKRYNPR